MGVGGQRHALAALPPGMTRYSLYRRLGGPQGQSGRVRKISPPPGFDPQTIQHVANRYTDWATPGYLDRLIKEAIEKRLNKENFDTDGGFIFNQAWSPVTSILVHEKQDQAERVLDSTNEPSSYRHQLCAKGSICISWRGPTSQIVPKQRGQRMAIEKLVYSPLNHTTRLLAWEYFIDKYHYLCAYAPFSLKRLIFGREYKLSTS